MTPKSTASSTSTTTSAATASAGSSSAAPAAASSTASASALPTASDVQFVAQGAAVEAKKSPIPGGLGKSLTPGMVTLMTSSAVVAFYGSRANLAGLAASGPSFLQAEGVSQRLANGADIASRIGATDGAVVLKAVSQLMQEWAAFSAQFPTQALELQALRDWWVQAHPGNKKKSSKAKAPAAAATPSEAAPAGSAAPVASAVVAK